MDDGPSRASLDAIDRDLARLRAQYEVAMSAFRFDEAGALQRLIAARDDERRAAVAALPEPAGAVEPPSGVAPVLAQPRRRGPRR